jgi:organic hydroperoxide reductase OsmC/OhrA
LIIFRLACEFFERATVIRAEEPKVPVKIFIVAAAACFGALLSIVAETSPIHVIDAEEFLANVTG